MDKATERDESDPPKGPLAPGDYLATIVEINRNTVVFEIEGRRLTAIDPKRPFWLKVGDTAEITITQATIKQVPQ